MKRFLAVVLFLCIAVTLCSCAPGSTSSSTTSEEPPRTVLKMAAWAKMPSLVQLVNDYNSTHSDTQIELTVFYDPDAGDEFEASQTRASAELLVERNFDLYALHSLNVAGLRNAGLLADLVPYMEADESFHEEDYYMHLWDLFKVNGALYEFVPTFAIAGLFGAERDVGNRTGWTLSEFTEVAEGYEGDTPYLGIDRDWLLSYMIQYTLSDYVDIEGHTCDFMNDSFYDWLDFIKDYDGYRTASAPTMAGGIDGLTFYYQYATTVNDTYIITGMPQDSAGGPCIMAVDSFAISSTTQQPELCWEFMQYLMEEPAQQRFFGFSMRRDLLEPQLSACTLPNDNPDAYFYGWEDGEGNPLPHLSEETVDYLRNLLETINTVKFRDDQIYNIVTEEAQIYFEEDAFTREEIAARIQSRVSTCLEEAKD